MTTPKKSPTAKSKAKIDPVLKELNLTDVKPNSFNYRSDFSGSNFDDFVNSVRSKGVIQPIQVRPVKGKIPYEIVFGERRYRASKIIAKQKGGKKTIPAIVKTLSDDEAYDLMVIENLQRDDLNELEEAKGFKIYLDKNGREALQDLADRTGIKAAFIRRRVSVLSLPQTVLKAWGDGEITYGYLEQLTRLDDETEILEYFDDIQNEFIESIRDLKHSIDVSAIKLDQAVFDLKSEGCLSCASNSDTQIKLFEVDAEATKCLKPKCFGEKQTAWLNNNWEKSEFAKKYKTNGYRFSEGMDHQERMQCKHFHYPDMIGDDCAVCDAFITLFNDIRLETFSKRICFGTVACFKKHKKVETTSTTETNPESGEQGDQPRVKWHGEHFREIFYQTQIPQRFEGLADRGLKAVQMTLFALINSDSDLGRSFLKKHTGKKTDEFRFPSNDDIFAIISVMDLKQVHTALKDVTLEVVMDNAFLASDRRIIGDHIGIDLSKEWLLNEEYLNKKTIGEMLAMGEQFGIFSDPKAKKYLEETIRKKSFNKCRKPELIDIFIKSGADLSGKVPDEILN